MVCIISREKRRVEILPKAIKKVRK
jgi:hypothetical protein